MADLAPVAPQLQSKVKRQYAPGAPLDLKYQYIQDYNRCKTPADKFNCNREYIGKLWPNENISTEDKDDRAYQNKLLALRRIRNSANRIENFVESVADGIAEDEGRRPPSRKRKRPFGRLPARTKEDAQLKAQRSGGKINVILALSGSVAVIGASDMIEEFKNKGCEVKVIVTERAKHFLQAGKAVGTWPIEPENILDDLTDTRTNDALAEAAEGTGAFQPQPVVKPTGSNTFFSAKHTNTHSVLLDWGDMLVVAPASANTVAKIAGGIGDNLLTSVARAWNFKKPCVIVPSMNSFMWKHPATALHVAQLDQWGWKVLDPQDKGAAADINVGSMPEPQSVVKHAMIHLRTERMKRAQ